MVGHFVRLKIRLLANRLRTQTLLGKIGFVVVWLGSAVVGTVAGLMVALLGTLLDQSGTALILAYSVVFLGWVVIPVAVSTVDETLDPRRFELLPLSARRLTTGLLTAAAVGPGSVGTFLGLLAVTGVSFPGWARLPVNLVAVLVELSLCLLVARVVTTLLSNMLASRRGRELMTLAVGVTVTLLALLPTILGEPGSQDTARVELPVDSVSGVATLAWLPPGALARSVGLVAEGRPWAAGGLIFYALAVAVVLGWIWWRSVRRALVTASSSGHRSVQRVVERELALVPDWLHLPSGPLLGVAAKELRYLVRDNRVRAQLLGSAVAVVAVLIGVGRGLTGSEYAPFLAIGAAFLLVTAVTTNQFGFDGGSLWGYVVSPAGLPSVVRGKNLGWGMVTLPAVIVVAIAAAFLGGGFAYVLAGILAAVAVMLIWMAIGNVTSIYGAYPFSESNPFSSRGASASAVIVVLISMVVSGSLTLPLAALIGLPAYFLGPFPSTLGAMLGVGYAALVYKALMRVTSRLLAERQQQLLDTIDGDRA